MPEVSIIVPIYNTEKYLPRCIDSILGQTYKDFELLLIDDGSTDNSGKICDEYAEKYSRIRVFHKENGGVSSARNMGLDNASSPWISFVDSDDYVSSNMIKRALEIQESTQADIVEFGTNTVYEYVTPTSSPKSKIQVFSGKEMIARIYLDCFGGCVYQMNKIYRSDLFQTLRFENGRINEDTIIAPIEYYSAGKVAVTDEILYFYFAGAASITRSEFSLRKLDALHAFESNRDFYMAKGLKKELELLDASYAFALKKMISRIKEKYGSENDEYKINCRKYADLFHEFMRNKKINIRQKINLYHFYKSIKADVI